MQRPLRIATKVKVGEDHLTRHSVSYSSAFFSKNFTGKISLIVFFTYLLYYVRQFLKNADDHMIFVFG